MLINIAIALAEFQTYLSNNLSKPINLSLLVAFSIMQGKILAAIMQGRSYETP